MRKPWKSLLLFSIICSFAFPIFAEDGFYLGGSVGQSQVNTGAVADIQVEGDDTGYKVFGGYRFLKFFAVEGAYADLGSIKDNQVIGTTTVDMQAITGEVVGFIPFGVGDIFGKAGMAAWNADFSADGGAIPFPDSNDGTDLVYGAGVQFRVKSWGIRGEVEYYDVKESDNVYMYSVGASYTF